MGAADDPILDALDPLAEIPGWSGSMVIAATGTVLARSGAVGVEPDQFETFATKVSRLFESFASTGEEASVVLLKFAEKTLLIRPVLECFLVVAASPSANMPMLKTGVAMSIKRITAFAERQARGSDESAAGEAKAPAGEDVSGGYQRVYRGTRVE